MFARIRSSMGQFSGKIVKERGVRKEAELRVN